MSKQQNEALNYFDTHAEDWQNKAIGKGEREVNIIKQRNDYVIQIIDATKDVKSFMDLGCGTGQLVCDIAKRGIISTGIDFSNNMIDIATQNAKKSGLGKEALFVCNSIFDYDFKQNEYDAISGNGLIEYISFDELGKILEKAYKALRYNGKLILGSRNRLFNIFSLNKFTISEIENRRIEQLLLESIALANAKSIDELSCNLVDFCDDEYLIPNTGIDVETRKQYTPLQLFGLLESAGYNVCDLYPIHIHGVNPMFKASHEIEHTNISNYLQCFASNNFSLIPFSSSFMICATKK